MLGKKNRPSVTIYLGRLTQGTAVRQHHSAKVYSPFTIFGAGKSRARRNSTFMQLLLIRSVGRKGGREASRREKEREKKRREEPC